MGQATAGSGRSGRRRCGELRRPRATQDGAEDGRRAAQGSGRLLVGLPLTPSPRRVLAEPPRPLRTTPPSRQDLTPSQGLSTEVLAGRPGSPRRFWRVGGGLVAEG